MTANLILCVVVISATILVSQAREQGACYRQYIPPANRFPHSKCQQKMGGNPATLGVFIRNDKTCCRRRQASGWGNEIGCKSCSSVRGFLHPWGEWSSCSKSCGWGEQRRHRVCSNNVCAGVRGRRKTETRSCLWKACCPVDGDWASWSHWSGCSASCGYGLQYRTRTCSSPSPSCGGRPCQSHPRQMQRCRIGQCAKWSSWTIVSPCSVTCGIGNEQRTRACNSHLGDKCSGEPVDYLPCNAGSCAVDGGWCTWNPWSTCTSTCQHTSGTKKRSRWCECPVPHNGGRTCSGSDGEVEHCSSKVNCPVHGGWSSWSFWGDCSAEKCSTSSGVRHRTRKCNNPPPKYGGTCEGPDAEEKACINLDDCEIEGVYGEWSPWLPCTTTCGSCAIKIRDRECRRSIAVMNTDIIGNPKFICKESKLMEKLKCELDACPDGSDPCEESHPYDTDDEDYDDGEEFEDHLFEDNWEDSEADEDGITDDEHVLEGFSGDYTDPFQWNAENDDLHGILQLIDEREKEKEGRRDSDPIGLMMAPLTSHDDGEEDQGETDSAFVSSATDPLAQFELEEPSNHDDKETERESEEELIDVFERKDPVQPDDDFSGSETEEDTFDDSLMSHELDGSGEIDLEVFGDKDWCDALKDLTGEVASRATGCCEILSEGLTNHTDRRRLEECFTLHFEIQIGDADAMVEERAIVTCRYKNKAKYLQTICCLWPECGRFSKKFLRNQCQACRSQNACQSCHNILLSG